MTHRTLRLAKDLTFPLDAVTQTFLVVGKRGSGKSNTAARFVEQLHHAHLPFVVLDPVDTWWGLKAGRDGEKGLDVYVFGGRKADLPLEPGGGALIADVLCEHRLSMVLSVKHLSGRERSTFMVDFARTLFQKWAGGPLHVVLEEAHELAPQNTQNAKEGEQAMLGAFKRLWKLGRASGIGGTAVTQRPASLSKDITTQSEILIAHRTIGPQDVKAIGEWVKYHGEHLDILADLPTLPTGEAFIWAPEFPEGDPIGLKRTSVLLRETYDSASTPKVGEQRVEPKELAAVDLERLRLKMAATIEKAKAEDPRELRKQIAELNKKLSVKVSAPAEKLSASVGKPLLTDADRALLVKVVAQLHVIENEIAGAQVELLAEHLKSAEESLRRVWHQFEGIHQTERANFARLLDSKGFQKILGKLATVSAPPQVHPTTHAVPRSPQARRVAPALAQATSSRPARLVSADASLGKGERVILTAVAQYPDDGVTREQLTILTGYKRSSRDTYLQRLTSAGFATLNGNGNIHATEAGVSALGDFEPLPTGDELRRYWLDRLSGGEQALLRVLVEAYPKTVDREALSEATEYKRSSRDTYLQRLSARKLIVITRDGIRASEELFT
jgi:uncharacterized protein